LCFFFAGTTVWLNNYTRCRKQEKAVLEIEDRIVKNRDFLLNSKSGYL